MNGGSKVRYAVWDHLEWQVDGFVTGGASGTGLALRGNKLQVEAIPGYESQ